MAERSATVLIIDDDPFVRDIMEFVLASGGYLVESAEDGAEALRKIRTGITVDAIVSDMIMPGMSGLELTRRLRGANVDIPIIVLTGDSELPAAAEALKAGANEYLVKDEGIQDTVLAALDRVLEKYRGKTNS